MSSTETLPSLTWWPLSWLTSSLRSEPRCFQLFHTPGRHSRFRTLFRSRILLDLSSLNMRWNWSNQKIWRSTKDFWRRRKWPTDRDLELLWEPSRRSESDLKRSSLNSCFRSRTNATINEDDEWEEKSHVVSKLLFSLPLSYFLSKFVIICWL